MVYILIINMIGFICMCLDKQLARHNRWRIPEKVLFLIAIIGGSVGSWLGMYAFRHKTKHLSFVVGIPLILLMQILGCLGFLHLQNL